MKLKDRDKQYIWHPLTQHKLHPDNVAIVKAKGSVLYDEDGNEYIDGIASWYTCMYGHCNPYIISKVSQQMKQLDQVVFSGFTHQPAIVLSEKLIEILPNNQHKIFFSDNGSTSVEVAIKMALQYHSNKENNKAMLIAFEDGFHGDTFGAMSVSGLSVYNGPFEAFFIDVKRIPTPNDENIDEVLELLQNIIATNNVAAFVYEPLLQGAAGMKIHSIKGLERILQFCQQNGVLTIADEVMTGFGKTGRYFASDHLLAKPDIMCLSKALTAGVVPMGITTCSQEIYSAFYSDKLEQGLFHGHTYSANPLSCSAAIAGIELLQSDDIQQNISRIIKSHKHFDTEIKNHPKIKSTRQIGIVYALDLETEMERYGNLRDKLFDFFMKNGVYLRPLGSTIYIQPPYVISEKELNIIYDTIRKALTII